MRLTTWKFCFASIATAFFVSPLAHGATLFSEGFETDGGNEDYVSSIPEATDGDDNYWTRTDGTGLDVAFSNQDNFYFAVQDTDDSDIGGNDSGLPETLTWTGIDISGYTDLSFSGYFAEDDASNGDEDWDMTSQVTISVQIDGGGYVDILSFANEGNPSSPTDRTNELPRQDTDFDGLGDGPALTDTFTEYIAGIAGTGTLLDLRLSITGLDAADEDIAVDRFVINSNVVPEPASALLVLGLGSLMLTCYRCR